MSIEYSLMFQEREHFYEARFIPLLEDQIIVIIRNVTERKMAEKAIRESEAKYRSIFENSVEGIFQITPAGELLNVNPTLARMFGYGSPEEMLTSSSWVGGKQFVLLQDSTRFIELIGQYGVLQGFETQDIEKIKTGYGSQSMPVLSEIRKTAFFAMRVPLKTLPTGSAPKKPFLNQKKNIEASSRRPTSVSILFRMVSSVL